LTLPALFAAQALRTPDAVAVIFEERVLSYAELEAHANALAHHLQSLGAGPETVVGLLLERSPEMVIGLIGILKAGAAYLPLDPNYPHERLAEMILDAGLRVVLTQSAFEAAVPLPEIVTRIVLDGDGLNSSMPPMSAPALDDLHPGHPAYVISPSGATGKPKGAINSHEGLRNRLLWMQDAYRLGP